MARVFQFDVDTVVEQLNRILQMELAAVIYYTHYSFMIYGHARIPITSWLRDNATESLSHAQEAGQMIMRLHKRPALGIAALPATQHNTIDEILAESIQREEATVELYRELLAVVKDKSVVLEEYATRLVSAEAVHLRRQRHYLRRIVDGSAAPRARSGGTRLQHLKNPPAPPLQFEPRRPQVAAQRWNVRIIGATIMTTQIARNNGVRMPIVSEATPCGRVLPSCRSSQIH